MPRPSVERDHALYPEKVHESTRFTRLLRRNPSLIIPMDGQVHEAKHQAISTIPLLDRFTAQRVHSSFEPNPNDHIESVYKYMRAIEEAIKRPNTQDIERSLGLLAVHAMELQLPFFKEGIVLGDK